MGLLNMASSKVSSKASSISSSMASTPSDSGLLHSPEVLPAAIHFDAPELGPLLENYSTLLIYTKSNPHFERLRLLHNREIRTVPKAIIRPRSEGELASAVAFCAGNGFPMAIRSGGYDLWGRSLIAGGVVVDVRALDGVSVTHDERGSFATVGAGARVETVLEVLGRQGLTTPVGWCDQVGYVGWAAGGGYGLLSGYYGTAAGQILGGRVVTPGGLVVDTNDDPELLCALRGAGLGGNFGVILDLRVRVYPRPRVLAGLLVYPLAESRAVLGSFEALCREDLPPAFSGEVLLANPGTGNSVMFFYHWILDETNRLQAMEHLEKMKALGTLLLDTVTEMALADFSTELIDILLENPPPPPEAKSNILFHHAPGGGLRADTDVSTAARKRQLVLGIRGLTLPDVADPELKAEAYNQSTKINRELRERRTGPSPGYWSFTPPELCDPVDFFGEEAVHRLRALKNKYNPGDAFPKAYPNLR